MYYELSKSLPMKSYNTNNNTEGPGVGKKARHSTRSHLSINIGHLSSQHNSPHSTFDLHALEGRPFGLGELHVLRDDPLLLQIHLHTSISTINTHWRENRDST